LIDLCLTPIVAIFQLNRGYEQRREAIVHVETPTT